MTHDELLQWVEDNIDDNSINQFVKEWGKECVEDLDYHMLYELASYFDREGEIDG